MTATVAVLTEAHQRSVLAAVRGLGREGTPVVAMAPAWSSAGRLSRYAAARAAAPDPVDQPTAHRAAVEEVARRHPTAVVYPGTEMSLDVCLTAPGLRLPYARRESLAALRDKSSLSRLAVDAGLRAPEVLYHGPVRGLDAARLTVPYVVKPVRPAPGGLPATVVRSRADLEVLLCGGDDSDVEVLAQELVEAPLAAATLVLDDQARVRAEFHQRALRVWPPGAGSSSRAVGLPPRPDVTRRVVAMLEAAGYAGLVQVQYLDAPDGPYVLDANPRFYGSLPLALASGANLPAAWHDAVCGEPYVAPREYLAGVTFRWLEADLADARSGDLRALLPPRRPRVGAAWSSADPAPGTAVALGIVRRIARARLAAGEAPPVPTGGVGAA